MKHDRDVKFENINEFSLLLDIELLSDCVNRSDSENFHQAIDREFAQLWSEC